LMVLPPARTSPPTPAASTPARSHREGTRRLGTRSSKRILRFFRDLVRTITNHAIAHKRKRRVRGMRRKGEVPSPAAASGKQNVWIALTGQVREATRCKSCHEDRAI